MAHKPCTSSYCTHPSDQRPLLAPCSKHQASHGQVAQGQHLRQTNGSANTTALCPVLPREAPLLQHHCAPFPPSKREAAASS
jgi:hypothetical protein